MKVVCATVIVISVFIVLTFILIFRFILEESYCRTEFRKDFYKKMLYISINIVNIVPPIGHFRTTCRIVRYRENKAEGSIAADNYLIFDMLLG